MKKSRNPSQRQLRIGEELRHAIAEVFERNEWRDPVLREVAVTFSEVQVGNDLRRATVFVSPLGGQNSDEVVDALSRASSFLRSATSKRVRLRYMPTLKFEHDNSFDQADRIDELLRRPEIARDLVWGGKVSEG